MTEAKIECPCGSEVRIRVDDSNRGWDDIKGAAQFWESGECPECDRSHEVHEFVPEE